MEKKNYRFEYCNLGYYILLFIIFVLVCWNISLISENKKLERSSNFYQEYSSYYVKEYNECNFNYKGCNNNLKNYDVLYKACQNVLNKYKQKDSGSCPYKCPIGSECKKITRTDKSTYWQCIESFKEG